MKISVKGAPASACCVRVSNPAPKENDHNVRLVNSSFDSLCTASRGQRDLRLEPLPKKLYTGRSGKRTCCGAPGRMIRCSW